MEKWTNGLSYDSFSAPPEFSETIKETDEKLTPAEIRRFRERRDLFIRNPFHPLLKNHPLRGRYDGYRSFSVGGDLVVIFTHEAADLITLAAIGTHHELYGS
ncbi:MAG: type II toxin-antitoxin system mRNA interferase toxin, RelE/StbE family [Candidatus Vogelbacteria bacterium]|nr:type II toxin-antitoxin system mRNA interferase toxin, RelE/StbE family [Candidatus Vogelbacteria bacterium]